MSPQRRRTFLLDVNAPESLAVLLRSWGHEVVRSADQLDREATDEDIARSALRENQIVATWDRDFNNLRSKHPVGVLIFAKMDQREGVDELGHYAAEFDSATVRDPFLVRVSRQYLSVARQLQKTKPRKHKAR